MGASHPEEYVQRAHSLGYQGLGICDYDGLYGIVKAHCEATKLGGFQCFYGAEVHLKKDHDLPLLVQDTLILYALNLKGYQALCRLLSYSHRDGKRDANIPLETILSEDLSQLICIIPMRGQIRTEPPDSPAIAQRWRLLKEAFGPNLHVMISRHLNPSEDAWITPTLRLAKQWELPLLFCQDPYFHQQNRKDLSDLLQAIRINKTVYQSTSYMFINDERCLKSPQEFHERYRNIPGYDQALRHSHDLAQKFTLNLGDLRYQYPKEMIPEGYTAHGYLCHLVEQEAKALHKQGVPPDIQELLNKELLLVEQLGFADYFLTVWDIVRWARAQHILCQGRGSAANSAICFVLGITSVDPNQFDLLFERFISVERGDPPDIDVDFEHERREEVIQHIYQHYGRDRAAMVANVITFRSRGAIRFSGKALGVPEHILSDASKLQETRIYRHAEMKQKIENQVHKGELDPFLWHKWTILSEKLKGFPRHMGVHSGGFVLTHDKVEHLVPQEPATMEDRTVVQWSKDDLEELGFFKIDILALGMLTAVRKTMDLIQRHHDRQVTMATIPQDDDPTYKMIQNADTVGTFQIESRAQMSMLPRLKPRNFYDLAVQVGIIRPGPIQGGLIHPFLRRRDGLEPVVYAHPKLEPILKRTLGVPIFQEQVMRIAIAVGNFTPGQADRLRKQIGAWSLKKDISPMMEQLIRGMRQNKISEPFIEQIIGHLKGFAEYGFPESHAISFAHVAYASSWLKCHYPAAFFASLINSQPMGFYSPHALLQAAKRDGVKVLPVCINHSTWDTSLERPTEEEDPCIRLGFNMVRGLSKVGADHLVSFRSKRGIWSDLDAFLRQSPLYRNDLTALTATGALSCLDVERRAAIWIAEAVPYAPLMEEDLKASFPEEDPLTQAERDFESFGTTLGDHPSLIIKKQFWCFQPTIKELVPAHQLANKPNNLMVKTFGMILVRQAPATAKGMVFFTLEDEHGFFNLAFTPQVYARYRQIINGQGFLCTEGKLQKSGESHSILISKVYEPQVPEAEVIDLHKGDDPIEVVTRKTLSRARNYM